jgi:RNA polymerase sigma factor (TIGR02999 family)
MREWSRDRPEIPVRFPSSLVIPLDRPSPANLTLVLNAINAGDASATDRLLPVVYEELRKLARHHMAHESPGQTLQPTALVHEAYLRLVGGSGGVEVEWQNRGHFFSAAATAMRRILIELARKHRSVKHGGGQRKVSLDDVQIAVDEQSENILHLDEALAELERRDERKGRITLLRYFAGLTIEQTAAALDLSPTTVKDEWAFARAWLQSEINRRGADDI